MEKYHIELTEIEAAILAQIDLRDSHRNHDEGHAAYKANAQPIIALLKSLSDRSAVPKERLNYWNDPRYHHGRIKTSRKGLFERNGRTGAEIYTHPHFLRHLRYFLFGAELPDDVITRLRRGSAIRSGYPLATSHRSVSLPGSSLANTAWKRQMLLRSFSNYASTWGSA
ncbi:hypothetical protein [Bradyrhizobium sp. 5.13L]